MDTGNIGTEEEIKEFTQFKKKLAGDAAMATIARSEVELYDTANSKELIKNVCREANTKKIGGVCVLPSNVKPCVSYLGADPNCALITCVSMPHGGDTTEVKVAAVKRAIKDGVDEVEVTAPVPYIRDGNWSYFKRELKKLKKLSKKAKVRVVVPCNLLENPDIIRACTTIAECGISALRLSDSTLGDGVNTELITKVCGAVKDKCAVKVDGINSHQSLKLAQSLGVSTFGSKYALDIATQILSTIK
jgi:deoxyribose-phosphate aldolase